MRESLRMAPMYVAMIGAPVLMFLAMLSYLFYPIAAKLALIPLITIGLLVFGIMGAREVYLGPKHRAAGADVWHLGIKTEYETVHQGEHNQVTLNVKRFNTATGKMEVHPYMITATRFTTVLEALIAIKEKKDNTLSMRYSCRMGICGSCGMVINGKPSLACEANIFKSLNGNEIEVAPMEGHPILKDLVDDFDDFFSKHQSIHPYLYRDNAKEQYSAKKEYKQSRDEINKFLPYSYCIMCGLCNDACPVVNTNPDFIGPQALSQVYRYNSDSRDQHGDTRINLVDTLEGLWSCEFAGACSKVCPKGVDPATAIQLLKNDAIKK
jgi:succinate dehydrogenase / fumarate reductase iron-sulfur subunit